MRVKLDRSNLAMEITIGDGQGLATGRSATIQQTGALPYEGCDKLRSFVLNNTQARPEGGGSRNVSAPDLPGRGEESSRSQFDSVAKELVFCFRPPETDCSYGHGLIVPADLDCGFESISPGPAFDEPRRMCTAR